MNLIRPNGLVERLSPTPRHQVEFDGYGRAQSGPATSETQLAARRDRRQRRRRKQDPLRGRVVDLTA